DSWVEDSQVRRLRRAWQHRLFHGSDPATSEDAFQTGEMPAAEQIPVGIENRARALGERSKAVELEVTFDDDAVGALAAELVPDVPERCGPDLAVQVFVGCR